MLPRRGLRLLAASEFHTYRSRPVEFIRSFTLSSEGKLLPCVAMRKSVTISVGFAATKDAMEANTSSGNEKPCTVPAQMCTHVPARSGRVGAHHS
jgi:hypothetical protein